MSTPNPALVAAAPAFDATLVALETFVTNLGPDPAKVPVTFPGALTVLLGTLQLQVPVLANAEFGVAQSAALSGISDLRAKLKAATTAPAT